MEKLIVAVLMAVALMSCHKASEYEALENELQEFAEGKDAKIGVAVIVDGGHVVEVNGSDRFPMMSVYKFPISMAVAEYCRAGAIKFADSCLVTSEDLHHDTYSPMMEVYGDRDSVSITFAELLKYALQQSDNNASDILLSQIDGIGMVDKYVEWLGIDGMDVVWTEDELHKDNRRSLDNSSTPLAAAKLVDKFDREFNDTHSLALKRLLETCVTGRARLVKPLPDDVVVGHKTGTGFITPDGRIMAVNDVGYVHLPDGRRYSIAVFIADSGYDMKTTEGFVADISAIVYKHINRL